jgi:hypothetical protein
MSHVPSYPMPPSLELYTYIKAKHLLVRRWVQTVVRTVYHHNKWPRSFETGQLIIHGVNCMHSTMHLHEWHVWHMQFWARKTRQSTRGFKFAMRWKVESTVHTRALLVNNPIMKKGGAGGVVLRPPGQTVDTPTVHTLTQYALPKINNKGEGGTSPLVHL